MLAQQDCNRVGFFSGCAPHNAYPNLAVCALAFKQLRNHPTAERLECLGVAKELGDADQQILEKLIGFLRSALQDLDLLFDGLNLQGFLSTLLATCERALHVLADSVANPPPKPIGA